MKALHKTAARFACAAALGLSSLSAHAQNAPQPSTVERIKARGHLVCPVPTSPYLGFFEIDDKGNWKGFDIDICKSIATAILGKDPKITFNAVSWADRFPAIQSGTIDLISMFTSWTKRRDTTLNLSMSNPYLFAGVRLMVPVSLGVKSAKELDGATICAPLGSTADIQLVSYLSGLGVQYKMLTFEKMSDVTSAYQNGRCEAISAAGPGLATFRAGSLKIDAHEILPDAVTMEITSVVTRAADTELLDIVNWTLAALMEADRLGITQANVQAKRDDPNSSNEVKHLLGVTPGVGSGLNLADDWVYTLISTLGNYSDIYDRNLGAGSPYKLPPGQNALWSNGGLLWAPTFD